jgi:hypothetical protein
VHFPPTAEEGLRQTASLSVAAMGMFKDEIRKSPRTKGEGPVERETRRLMAQFCLADEKWKAGRKETRVRSKKP